MPGITSKFKLYLSVVVFCLVMMKSALYKVGHKVPPLPLNRAGLPVIVHETRGTNLRRNPCRTTNNGSFGFKSRCVHTFDNEIPTLTAHTDGRLGNQMFAYATVFAMAMYNERPAHMSPVLSQYLTKYFQVTLDTLDDDLFANTEWTRIVLTSNPPSNIHTLPRKDDSGSATRIQFNGYAIFWKYFDEFRSQILQEFKFHPEIQSQADKIIHAATVKWYPHSEPTSVTVIGVHVRRGDFVTMATKLNLHLPTTDYYLVAMSLLAEKVKNPLYIVASNHIPWCKEAFSNFTPIFAIEFLEPKSEYDGGYDLAVLSNCHHLIYGFGTFGFWAGYFSPGIVIHCSDCEKDTYWMKKGGMYGGNYENAVPPRWIGISYGISFNGTQSKMKMNSRAVTH